MTHWVIQESLLGVKFFFLIFTNDLLGHLPSAKQMTYDDDVQFLDSDLVENLPKRTSKRLWMRFGYGLVHTAPTEN